MKVRRAILAAFTAWLAVVLVGATMVWAVISRAGQELVADDTLPGSSARSAPATVPGDPIRTTGPGAPMHRRKHRDHPSAPGASSGQGEEPSSGPTDDPSDPSPPGRSSGDDSASPPAPPAQPQVRTATWNEAPGAVTISCKGPRLLAQWGVTEHAGWDAELPEYSSSSNRLRVHFEENPGDGEYDLTATCVAGAPHFGGGWGDHDDEEEHDE